MIMTLLCPQCSSKAYKRNGYTRHGKQNYRCLDCGRQFSCERSDALNLGQEDKIMSGLLTSALASARPLK